MDGYDADTNTVYEFKGCFWQGCPDCYPNRSENHRQLEDCSMAKVYCYLWDKGYNTVVEWGCQWENMKKEREDVKAFVDRLNFAEPLDPRDAFCGGRTNAVSLYHLAVESWGEKIKHFDYTLLYLHMNKNGMYPVGHPKIISRPGHTDISQYFGLAKCPPCPHRNCSIRYCH